MKRRKKSYYDPGPRRHNSRGHRKGVEPPGLRRWRLAHRSTHDPIRRVKHSYSGPRGGSYWQGPKTRRYDPAPRAGRFARARRYGGKAESMFNKWAAPLGFLGVLGYGTYDSYNKIAAAFKANNWSATNPDPVGNKTPWERYIFLLKTEYTHLYKPSAGWTPENYLKYKFLGTDPSGAQTGSSWSTPFILSLIGFVATTAAKLTGKLGKYSRIITPLNKLSKGALVASVIGALVLPGTGKIEPGTALPLAQPRTLDMTPNQNGVFEQKIGGAF